MYAPYASSARRGHWTPETGVPDSCELLGTESGPLKGQQGLLPVMRLSNPLVSLLKQET